jgi:hypothetical protein
MTVTSSTGAVTLGEAGKNLLLTAGALLYAAPTGVPVASLCLDTNGQVIKKTTTGPCI